MLFGNTVTITADGPWQHLLYELTGRKWGNLDVENETGCGVVPYVYKEKNLVNAVQWAVGLELLLLIDDPWRVFLTTDHPNGAAFWRYPEIMQLLMDADFRKEQLKQLPDEGAGADRAAGPRPRVHARTRSRSSPRPARPARSGLPQKGHLGVGADADVAIFNDNKDAAEMFSLPAVRPQGRRVSSSRRARSGTRSRASQFASKPDYDPAIEDYLRPLFQQHYTMSFENYPVAESCVHGLEVHA